MQSQFPISNCIGYSEWNPWAQYWEVFDPYPKRYPAHTAVSMLTPVRASCFLRCSATARPFTIHGVSWWCSTFPLGSQLLFLKTQMQNFSFQVFLVLSPFADTCTQDWRHHLCMLSFRNKGLFSLYVKQVYKSHAHHGLLCITTSQFSQRRVG